MTRQLLHRTCGSAWACSVGIGDGHDDSQAEFAQAACEPATEMSRGTELKGDVSRILRSAPV
jgi:hypothetical protein